MANERVSANKSKSPKARKSKIRKSIQRTLSTERYQSVVIFDEIEEEIEWKTIDERQKKIINWETILIDSFKRSHDHILDELGLSHKKAYIKNNLADKDYRPDPHEAKLDDMDELE